MEGRDGDGGDKGGEEGNGCKSGDKSGDDESEGGGRECGEKDEGKDVKKGKSGGEIVGNDGGNEVKVKSEEFVNGKSDEGGIWGGKVDKEVEKNWGGKEGLEVLFDKYCVDDGNDRGKKGISGWDKESEEGKDFKKDEFCEGCRYEEGRLGDVEIKGCCKNGFCKEYVEDCGNEE